MRPEQIVQQYIDESIEAYDQNSEQMRDSEPDSDDRDDLLENSVRIQDRIDVLRELHHRIRNAEEMSDPLADQINASPAKSVRVRVGLDRLLTLDEIVGAVAQGWCHPNVSSKEMDPDLAQAIISNICEIAGVRASVALQSETTEAPEQTKASSLRASLQAAADAGGMPGPDGLEAQVAMHARGFGPIRDYIVAAVSFAFGKLGEKRSAAEARGMAEHIADYLGVNDSPFRVPVPADSKPKWDPAMGPPNPPKGAKPREVG